MANGSNKISSRKLGSGFLQPESAATKETPPDYPYNNATKTRSGHSFELDDTKGRERIRLQHRTGTFIEMDPEGNETHKIYGNGYEIVVKDKNVTINGHCSITINSDCVVNINGNKTERIGGDYNLLVEGRLTMTGKKKTTLQSEDDMQITAGSKLIPGDGALRIYSNEDVYITSSVMVGGTLNADMLYAKRTVDAGWGMTAGFLGFVTLRGGVAAGLPLATPGCVNASVKVNAPLGSFGIMTSVLMTDIINTKIYSAHYHEAPKGLTGTPFFAMI